MGTRFGWRLLATFIVSTSLYGQDGATAALRGIVSDATGARVAGAGVTLRSLASGLERRTKTAADGAFVFASLPPTSYEVEITAAGMAGEKRTGIKLDVGGTTEISVRLHPGPVTETVTVTEGTPVVETQTGTVSDVIDSRAIEELPLNGRRFTDLALLTPGVTQDPRGLTSATNGDMAFGGVRGFHTTFLVDGFDNNNGFFAQARGRYRAPYQFSNETIQEFRVSSNAAGAEFGRSSGGVINVVTKSGTNTPHGSIFYYLRDGRLAATHPFVRRKFPDKQHQFGFSIGGPIRKRRVFYFAGFDQHLFHVPTVVNFEGGSDPLELQDRDFEASDQTLVTEAARSLSRQAGEFRTALRGNAGLLKVDANLSLRHHLMSRLQVSRFGGDNNVFFDDASPVTNNATASNGEERVATHSLAVALASVIGDRWTNNLRVQLSRDDQSSTANSDAVDVSVAGILRGMGRSSLLPRVTNETRWHTVETVAYQGRVHAIKFGVDVSSTKTANYFPLLFGGRYTFDSIRVNPFTFVPQTFGMSLTPLRAYAHQVPRRFQQNFGDATSHPDANDLALFVQDTIRWGDHVAMNFGVRYDLQTFAARGLEPNPIWPGSGQMPEDRNNLSPRLGLAATLGSGAHPLVLRGGFGIFYTRLPQIYASAIATQNGIHRQTLRLDNADFFDRQVFPTFPQPLVACAPGATQCVAPANVRDFLTTEISSFARDYQTPYAIQSNLTVEKEVLRRTAIGLSYLFVAGKHLIRARDANLPEPIELRYPVLDTDGEFTGDLLTVDSFARWQMARSLECPFPPCVQSLSRPISNVGAINVFETTASSLYHGLTLSAKRRMSDGIYFRLGYTWSQAADTGPDALVIERSPQIENGRRPQAEKARSVTDQRHRLVLAFTAEPRPFGRRQPGLARWFNDWKFAGVFSGGSGRPLSGRVNGDSNRDGNFDNDRLPGASRNSFTGPDYVSGEMRITRRLSFNARWRLEASAESFNLFNRNNKRIRASDDGFATIAGTFVPFRTASIGGRTYPGYFERNAAFLEPTDAYAPRQVQIALRLKF